MQAIVESAHRKGSILVVGLDPDILRLPPELLPEAGGEDRETAGRVREFCLGILEATAPFAAAVKLQSAYFEALGAAGVEVYAELISEAERAGLPTIADVKRGDIDSTAKAYAKAHLSRFGATCATVNPYMGS
ncbi:MAG: orotidine-5'-phosphate decarboxylase, partial [Rubrobacter sp.]